MIMFCRACSACFRFEACSEKMQFLQFCFYFRNLLTVSLIVCRQSRRATCIQCLNSKISNLKIMSHRRNPICLYQAYCQVLWSCILLSCIAKCCRIAIRSAIWNSMQDLLTIWSLCTSAIFMTETPQVLPDRSRPLLWSILLRSHILLQQHSTSMRCWAMIWIHDWTQIFFDQIDQCIVLIVPVGCCCYPSGVDVPIQRFRNTDFAR